MPKNLETAVLANGCFWCTEAIFQRLKGVNSVLPGYSGGHVENPTYEAVSSESTGHAESIQIKFDPKTISYEEILEVYFATHDPTTLNRQGNDVGEQYRSEIFYLDEKQKGIAENVLNKLNKDKYNGKIVTKISKLDNFYEAEDYHKNYYKNNPNAGYCRVVIDPKVKKLLADFSDKVKK